MHRGVGWSVPLASGSAQVRFTERADGDFRITSPADDLRARRACVVDLPWVGLRQVHGAGVAVVDGAQDEPIEADALVTATPELVVSVNVADCAPIALVSRQGIVAAVHAGWRGATAGVIEAAVDVMRDLGAEDIRAWLGPCIHPECYEFGPDDLESVTACFGPAVVARTSGGAPALDVPAVVAAALGRAGVPLEAAADLCTACDGVRFFSHRARRDQARHALTVWTTGGAP